ncbi:hypothetical protein ACWC98_11935 [Streptomyces goshikiensis]|uniref:hypothetical protein n=1 Tax=Streptomyces goshikiensis TaxID=1942 RepID=UPI0036B509CB
MIEILENLDLLSRPNLDLANAEVNGIALGASAAVVLRQLCPPSSPGIAVVPTSKASTTMLMDGV